MSLLQFGFLLSKPSQTQHFHVLLCLYSHRHVSDHIPSDGAQLEPRPGEADCDDDILSLGNEVNDRVLIWQHGVDAGLLHGYDRLHSREMFADEVCQGLLHGLRVSLVSVIRVTAWTIVQTYLKRFKQRRYDFSRKDF